MRVYSDGQSRVIKGSFPARFKLLNAGVEVPFIRTGKDSIRLSGEIPFGILDVIEVQKKKAIHKESRDYATFSIINNSDLDDVRKIGKFVAENQSEIKKNLSLLSEHEKTISSLETQNAQDIVSTKESIVQVAKQVGREIQNDREALKQTAQSITQTINETAEILSAKIEAHEEANNPHRITKDKIGLGNVDDTSDLNKPISKATQKALDKKADKIDLEEVKKSIDEAGKKQESVLKSIENANFYGGVGGNELPSGGKKGQALVKASNKDGDYKWVDPESGIEIIRVDELPATGKTSVLYLVPSSDPETSNIYDEYIWAVQSDDTYAWEKIGSTEIDLSGYVKSVNNQTPDDNGNVSLPPPVVFVDWS